MVVLFILIGVIFLMSSSDLVSMFLVIEFQDFIDPFFLCALTLCTDSYSIEDVVRLMNVLFIRYDLKCTLHVYENRYRIYI